MEENCLIRTGVCFTLLNRTIEERSRLENNLEEFNKFAVKADVFIKERSKRNYEEKKKRTRKWNKMN